MNYKKQTARKAKQEQPPKSSQLIVRSIIFLIGFIAFWFVVVCGLGITNDKIFISEVNLVMTWIISLSIIVGLWIIYLFFIVKDNSMYKIKRTLLSGGYSIPVDVSVKWFVLILLLIIIIYFSKPSLYSNINAIRHEVVFEGKTFIKEEGKSGDKRFVKVFIENGDKKYAFEGKAEEINPLINREVHLIIYQGIFTRYALIDR